MLISTKSHLALALLSVLPTTHAMMVNWVPDSLKQAILGPHECPANLPMTCQNSTPIDNECCFESPGGIMLQTQFWDYYPAIGANDSFTLHGLWPDNCDGTYEQFCDTTLNIKKGEIKDIVVGTFGDDALYSKIADNWKNFNGDDEALWIHEWSKHATCIKTIRPTCYDKPKPGQNIYDFFKTAVALYEAYPTFEFLKKRGIVPSLTATYSKSAIAEALSENFGGHSVFYKCNRYGALQEIWYYHYLRGPLRNGEFVQIPAQLSTNCPENVKFLPKGEFKPPPTQPPKDPQGKRGTLKLTNHPGCLISNGQHYTQGTCATFRLSDLQFGGSNLRSSRGVCGVNDEGEFNCNRQNTPARFQFNVNKNTGVVSYGGQSTWCFNSKNKHGSGKFTQTPIKLADGDCDAFEIKFA